MSKLDKIRQKIREEDEKKNNKGGSFKGDGLTYAFWGKAFPVGSTSVIRFLPDGNENNTYFWRERQMITLDFPGVVGQDQIKPVSIKVPCVEMWGDTCPVMQEIRPWFNTEQDAIARKYWKERDFIYHGFVRECPIIEEGKPENPIRKFVIGKQLQAIIRTALTNPEMGESPDHFVNGTDFRIVKGQKDKHFTYEASTWSRRETSLTEEEIQAIEKHGLPDLETYLPKKPAKEAVEAIFEMFEASLNGDLYDPARWGKFYRPWGLNDKKEEASEEAVPHNTPNGNDGGNDADVPFDADNHANESVQQVSSAAPAASGKSSANDILQRIRSRNAG